MKRATHLSVGIAISVLLLWWLFRSVDWQEFWGALQKVKTSWLLLAIVPTALSFVTRILRWRYVVRAADPSATMRAMFSATQIGFLANFTLPGRVGELVRAIVLSKKTNLSVSKSFATVALDRVNDLIGLMAVMGVALLTFRPTEAILIPRELFNSETPISVAPRMYYVGAVASGCFLVGVIAVFVTLYFNQAFVLRVSDGILGLVSKRLANWIHHLFKQFADGFHVFRSASDMAKSIAYSLVTWGFFILLLVFLLEAFDIDYPWYAPFVMQTLLAMAISVPGTPGFVGQFQVPLVAALKMLLPDIAFAQALAFAIVAHLFSLISVVGVGIFCLFLEGFSLSQLSRESSATEAAIEADESAR